MTTTGSIAVDRGAYLSAHVLIDGRDNALGAGWLLGSVLERRQSSEQTLYLTMAEWDALPGEEPISNHDWRLA